MKIHSDKLTRRDLSEACPPFVYADVQQCGSRKRTTGFNVYLEGTSPRRSQHNPEANAATWDEWGVWIAALFDIDPAAIIGPYAARWDFYDQTAKWKPRGATAPWLRITTAGYL